MDALHLPKTESFGWATMAHGVFRFFANQWQSVLFSAAISVILEHLGALRVLTKFSLLVVSSLASQGAVEALKFTPGMPAVIVINSADFITRYGEKSPLDRCTLAQDVAKVLSKSPKRLAVDFDLSPLVVVSESEHRCQRELDTLLDREAPRLVLLLPFPAATEALLRVKHEWMLARCRAGAHFADGNIEQSMGLVTEQIVGETPELGARMADQLHGEMSNHICKSIASTDESERNRWLVEQRSTVESESETTPINFPSVTRQLAVLPLGSEAFEGLPSLANSPVLLGGDWGRDDSFLTSIGPLPGVTIHGARLVSLEHPIHSLWPLLGLLSDIGIALCFAWVIERFWEAYVMARRLDLDFKRMDQLTALSAFLMTTFVLIYFSLVLFFFFAAEYYFSHWGVVIAPLLIAISMLVDGFVSGPVGQIKNLLEEEQSPEHRTEIALNAPLGEEYRVLLWQLAGAFVLMPCFWLLCWAVPSLAEMSAAWIFAAALLILYALMFSHAIGLRLSPASQWQKFVSGTAEFFMLRPHPALSHAAPDWRRMHRAGQILARIRALVFWVALLLAAWILFVPH